MSLMADRSSGVAGRTWTPAWITAFSVFPTMDGQMDRIELRRMSFQGRHGVRPEERAQAQEFKVDIRVEADLAAAARTDHLDDTVDYRQLRAAAQDVIEGASKKLLESLAGEIADRIL